MLMTLPLEIEGADDVSVENDHITVENRFGEYREIMPLCYSIQGDAHVNVSMEYFQDENGIIKFKSQELNDGNIVVIDPELVFSTYSGSTVDNFGFTATYDKYGNLYAGGIAAQPTLFANGRYPTTPGAYDQTYNGGTANQPANLACDISISKYDATGSTLLYATYLGGEDDEYPHSMIVDSSDNLVIYGTTYSRGFPTTTGCPQPLRAGNTDLIISKFSSDGSSLLGSTYMGGSDRDGLNQSTLRYFYADDFRGEVNIDASGNIYVASCTNSDNFPVTTGCLQNNNRWISRWCTFLFE